MKITAGSESFVLSERWADEGNITEGVSCSEREIRSLVEKFLQDYFFKRAVEYFAIRMRSELEVQHYLQKLWKYKLQKEYSNLFRDSLPVTDIILSVIAKLEEFDLINDEKFAVEFVDSRVRFKPRSESLIRFELKQKGIPIEIIDSVVSEFLPDEKILVIQTLQKRYKDTKIERGDNKKIRYLQGKGFNWDVISQVIDSETE